MGKMRERGLSVGWGWGGDKLVKNEGEKTERRERDEVRKDISELS